MANAVEFDDATFDEQVLNSDQPVLVDFSAAWCGPCKQLTPIIDELAGEYDGKAKVGKVDVDQSAGVAGKYNILSVPTVLFFNGGEKVETMVGLHPKGAYKTKLDELLGG